MNIWRLCSTAWKRAGPKAWTNFTGGPWAGKGAPLDKETGCTTAWLDIGGEHGRYNGGRWETWAEYEAQRKREAAREAAERAKWVRFDKREAA